MPLQFTTQEDLETDLASKPGIYAVDKIVDQWDDLQGFVLYDLAVIREGVDSDGTKRYIKSTQQILQDKADNSFGYGNNRQWDKVDRSDLYKDSQGNWNREIL